jgi:hypothetical protein
MRILTEKRNELYSERKIYFEISRTPGTVNLEKFTLFEFNENIKRIKERRLLSLDTQEEVNETLVLREKMVKYRAQKRKELIERLEVFK